MPKTHSSSKAYRCTNTITFFTNSVSNLMLFRSRTAPVVVLYVAIFIPIVRVSEVS